MKVVRPLAGLTNDITRRIVFFPLKKGAVKVNVPNIPLISSSKLTGKSKTRAGCGGRISLLVKALFVLKTT